MQHLRLVGTIPRGTEALGAVHTLLTVTTPNHQFIFYWLVFAMIHLRTNFEMSCLN